jgi:hypothetical protein
MAPAFEQTGKRRILNVPSTATFFALSTTSPQTEGRADPLSLAALPRLRVLARPRRLDCHDPTPSMTAASGTADSTTRTRTQSAQAARERLWHRT